MTNARDTAAYNLRRQIDLENRLLEHLRGVREYIDALCVEYSRLNGTTNLTKDQVLRDITFKQQRRAA